MSEDTDAFLAHHGIKGMRWGHRKQEDSAPKQVSKEVQAKREAKAVKFDKRANALQKEADRLKAIKTTNSFRQQSINAQRDDIMKIKMSAVKDANATRHGKLTSTQKKLIIGGVIVGSLVAAGVISYNMESGNFRRIAEKGKLFLNGGTSAFQAFKTNDKLKDKNLSLDDIQSLVVDKINPGYGDIGTKQNCRRATFAYEMRRRGYDVMATKTTNANGQNAMGLLNALTPQEQAESTSVLSVSKRLIEEGNVQNERLRRGSTKMKFNSTPLLDMVNNFAAGGKNRIQNGGEAQLDRTAGIFETLAKEASGSRGELGVTWKAGGGHSMAYEIFNGKPVIIDNQSGKMFKDIASFRETFGDTISTAGYTRLDDAHLNANFLLKWVKNAS